MGSLLKSLKKFGFVLPKLLLQPKQDFSDYSLFQFAANFWKSSRSFTAAWRLSYGRDRYLLVRLEKQNWSANKFG
jgi:hypothetical protein